MCQEYVIGVSNKSLHESTTPQKAILRQRVMSEKDMVVGVEVFLRVGGLVVPSFASGDKDAGPFYPGRAVHFSRTDRGMKRDR